MLRLLAIGLWLLTTCVVMGMLVAAAYVSLLGGPGVALVMAMLALGLLSVTCWGARRLWRQAGGGLEWRLSEEARGIGAIVRLETEVEPRLDAILRRTGCALRDWLLGPFASGEFRPSSAPTRLVRIWDDAITPPEILFYGRDVEKARIAFQHLVGQPADDIT